jgi:phytoene/squalene synthetase
MIADAAYGHCETLVRDADKNRYLTALFAPAERRPWLFALYAFNVEISRIPALAREPFAAAVRLQWWREALSGEREGEAAAHPVASALRDSLAAADVDAAVLIEYLDAQQSGEEASDATIFFTAARLLGVPAAGLGAPAARAGQAYALTMRGESPDFAREHFRALRQYLDELPIEAQPAFLPAALVPLLIRRPDAPQWRRQIALLGAAWLGFPRG